MKVTALLANHVEAINNTLYAAGAGINRTLVPPGTSGPYQVAIGLGVVIQVPWTQTNQNHVLTVDLVDADGHDVLVRTGPDSTSAFKAEMQFNVGRPPTLEVGEEQTVALAIGMPGLPMPSLGNYRFVISIDQSVEEELPYKIITQPGMTLS